MNFRIGFKLNRKKVGAYRWAVYPGLVGVVILVSLVGGVFGGMNLWGQLKDLERDIQERELRLVTYKDKVDEESGGERNRRESKGEVKENDGIIEKPLDPISEAARSRLLEYTIQLNYKVESIEKARATVLSVVKKESYIASAQTNVSGGYESMSLQVQIPVTAMYDTLLQMDKIGQLTYENIHTQDWTEHNELQKIKLSREALRMIRRSKAANKGSAETWNWKDREEALERSEDTADAAKLESWKIKDHVAWAKVNISISGKELPAKIQLPSGAHSLFLFALSCFAISSSVKEPSPSISPTSLIMNLLAVTFGRPFDFGRVLSSPNNPSCELATGDGL
jgi:hypothetical protein